MNRRLSDRAGERGQVLVLFALAAVVLLAAIGLGLDTGRMYAERRRSQAASDIAAQAAAHASCNGASVADSIVKGQQGATDNQYTTGGTTVVTITAVNAVTHHFRAAITSTVDATFSRVLGFNNFSVGTVAEAQCVPGPSGSGPGALFAGGDNCTKAGPGKYQLDVTGQDQAVYGGVHTNGDVNIATKPNFWYEAGSPDDPFTYVGQSDPDPIDPGNVFQTSPPPAYPRDVGPANRPWPPGWTPGVADPGASNEAYWEAWRQKAIADGNGGGSILTSKITTITQNGVWYTSHADGMDIGSVAAGVTNFTLIARNGPVKVSGGVTGSVYSPDADGNNILALSGKKYTGIEMCDKFTIAWSASNVDWNGIMWAPQGQIEFSGQGIATNKSEGRGSLIGWSIKLNGSNTVIRYDASLFTGDPSVLLVQ
jgi:hypothetical protein